MTTPTTTARTPFYKKRWVRIIGITLAVLVCLSYLFTFAAKYYVSDWLEKNGAEKATIEKLSFNPFLGRLSLGGVKVESKEKALLENSDMVIDIGISSLFRKNIRVENARYIGLMIDLEQYADGSWRFGSYTMKKAETTETVEVSEKDVATVWAFLADNVLLESCLVKFKTPDLDLALEVENAKLARFSTRDGHPAGIFSLQGKLNGEEVEINLDTLQIIPDIQVGGELRIASFKLKEIESYLVNALPVFSGDAGLNGKALFTMSDTEGMGVDYDGVIEIVSPSIGSESFATAADNLKWEGVVRFEMKDDTPMLVETDGLLSAVEYKLELPGTGLTNNEGMIALKGKTRVEIAENVAVKNDGSLEILKSSLTMTGLSLAEENLQWQGQVLYDSNHEGDGQYVQSDGSLKLGPFSYTGGPEEAAIGAGLTEMAWQGNIIYSQSDGGASSTIKLDGELRGDEIAAELEQQGIGFSQDRIEVTSESTLVIGKQLDISGANSIKLDQFKMLLKEEKLPLLSLKQLQIKELNGKGGENIEAEELSLDEFTFHGVEVDGINKPIVSLEKAQVSGISWTGESGISGDNLEFHNLIATVIRDKEGNINISQRLAPLSGSDKSEETENSEAETKEAEVASNTSVTKNSQVKESGSSMPLRLGKTVLTGNNNFIYEDYTLAVPYKTDLVITKLELGELDSSKPQQKTPIDFAGELEKRAPVRLSGDISPFDDKLFLDLDFSLKNYPLVSLSAYTVQAVGTALASGQLQLTTDLKLEDDMIDMNNNVLLKKLQTKKISEELAKELDNQLPIPLDTALGILRDSKDNIDLDIPLQGPISDFSIGISDVLITALSKAIVPAASGYMMYALGPYGALAYVGMKVGENMMQVNFPPVEFTPGSVELTEDHKQYLERMGKILTERPDTDLQVCPRVASWELMKEEDIKKIKKDVIVPTGEDETKLIELGQQRALAVQEFLATTYSVDKGRLLICETLIEQNKKTVPAVLLHL